MIHKSRGIVLNQHKYGETSLIVNIYTEKFGRQAYIVKGACSRKSKNKSNLYRPFILLDMEVYHKEGKDLQNIKEIKLSEPLINLPDDIKKSSQVLLLSEILYKVLREEEPNPNMFDFIYQSIQYLYLAQESTANFHLFFLVHLSRHLGFFPQLNHSEERPVFDLANGEFISETKTCPHKLEREPSKILDFLLKIKVENIKTLKISGKDRSIFLDSILEYYTLHIEGFSNIKSLSVLREIFS